jgi:hypothetical protein
MEGTNGAARPFDKFEGSGSDAAMPDQRIA